MGNLLPTRDFYYILDTVAGLLAICEIINFGTGREISIGNLAQEIADVLGPPLKLQEDVQRLRPASSEVDRPLAPISKRKSCLLGNRSGRCAMVCLQRPSG